MARPLKPIVAVSLIAGITLMAASGSPAQQPSGPPAVRVWTDTVTIPTYPLGPDDPNPHFRELGGSIIYPYTMQDAFGNAPVDREYRAAFLENEYLRVMVLPGLGGRIQSVLDKVTGEEMFHRNRVIRPGHIALRGAWISGGVEWNRGPQGHTVTSFSPVSVLPHQLADGSATLIIGNTEQVTRTAWEVRLTLRPGLRALEEQIRLLNPTDGIHPYYFWNNTAFPERPGTRFIFPMSLGTDHEGTGFFRWPIHEGRDLSWVRNHPGPSSIFGVEVGFDFFGAYDVDRDFGIVQHADHRVLPGKKAWTWGQSEAAQRAQAVLTETAGNYIEVQSGPLPTQSDYGLLAPGQEISWQERWYPVDHLGDGFEFATADAVVARRDAGGTVELRLAVTREFLDAELEITRQDGRVERRTLDLSPARTEQIHVEIPAAAGQGAPRLRIELDSADGRSLLDYESPLAIPEVDLPEPRPELPETAAGLYLRADRADRALDRAAARQGYEAAVEADPAHVASRVALAALELEAGRPAAAALLLEQALRLDGSDGFAWYLLGVARLEQDELEGAHDAAARALQRPGTVALGHGLIGRARARAGDHDGALESLTDALAAGGADWTRLFERILLATYGAGEPQAAIQLAQQSVRSGTVRLLPHLLPAIASDRGLVDAVRRVRAWLGEPEFELMEVAWTLADAGLYRDALNLLEAATVTGPHSALPFYAMAWLSDRIGEDSQVERWLLQASAAPSAAAFPSRREMVPALELAVRRLPGHGATREALGNLYAGLGRTEEARHAWRQAIEIDPSLSIAPRNLGLAARHLDGDLVEADRWLALALAAAPEDDTLARDLGQVRFLRGDLDGAAAALEPAARRPRPRADVVVALARTRLAMGRPVDAIELLDSAEFTNREGDSGAHVVFVDAWVTRGRGALDAGDPAAALDAFETALTYPEGLNVGRPHQPREARAQYWRGRALEALGRGAEAREAWRTCAAGAPLDDEQIDFVARCAEALSGGSRDL